MTGEPDSNASPTVEKPFPQEPVSPPDLTPQFAPDEPEELSDEEKSLKEGERNFLALTRNIRRRLRNDKDAIIVITGERGSGKTVLAHQLAKHVDFKFDMKTHTLFDPEVPKLKDIIYGFPKYSATVVDELIRIGYRRNWASVGNKLLIELYNLCRYQNQASLLCIPNFNEK